ncbi:MAG: hypothetical protein ABL911_10745, partial [Gallionella sp.]
LFRETGKPWFGLATIMTSDVVRFLYEPASWLDVLRVMIGISRRDTLRFGVIFVISVILNGFLIKAFYQRYKLVKGHKNGYISNQ